MSPIRHILGKAGIYGVAQGVSRALSLVALPILTRHLTTQDYGAIALLAVLSTSLRILFGAGILSAVGIVYFQSEEVRYHQIAVWTTLIGTILSSAAMMLLIAVFQRSFNGLLFAGKMDLGFNLLVYVLSLALQMASEPILLWLQFRGQAIAYSVFSVLGAFAALGASILFVVNFHLGMPGWIAGQLVGSIILFCGMAAFVLPALGHPAFSQTIFRALLRTGVPLIPGSVALLAMNQAAPFFMSRMADLASVGVFGVGYQLGSAIVLATSAFAAAWLPFFQSFMNRQDEASKVFPQLTWVHQIGFGAIVLLFFVFSAPVVFLLTPPKFHLAWQVVGPVALAQMLMSLWTMLLPGVYFSAQTSYQSLVQIAAALFTIGFYYIFIPAFGPVGGALPLVLGGLAMVGLQYAVNEYRRYHVQMVRLRIFLIMLTLLFAACGAVWWIWLMLGMRPASFLLAISVLLLFLALGALAGAPGQVGRLLIRIGNR